VSERSKILCLNSACVTFSSRYFSTGVDRSRRDEDF